MDIEYIATRTTKARYRGQVRMTKIDGTEREEGGKGGNLQDKGTQTTG